MIFISLPVIGQDDTWQKRERELRADIQHLFPDDCVISPGKINPLHCCKSDADCIADRLRVLLDPIITCVVFAENWKSSGSLECLLEHQAAIACKPEIIYEQHNHAMQKIDIPR